MASASVLNCSKVLTNANFSSIESNLTNMDLTWNWVFANCFRLETKAIGWNMAINNNVLSYFSKIDLVCGNFYGIVMQYCWQYDLYAMIALQCIMCLLMNETSIVILVLHYYFIFISAKRTPLCCMTLVICCDCNVRCNNINNLLNKSFVKCIFYSTYGAWCRIRWNKKDEKYKSINNMIGDLNIGYLLVFAQTLKLFAIK